MEETKDFSVKDFSEEVKRRLKEIRKEIKRKEKENQSGKNKRKKIIECAWCGFKATSFATRKGDYKKIPCCKRCIPSAATVQSIPWLVETEKI